MTTRAVEFDVLQQLMPALEAEGYEVFLQPNRQLLPNFLKGFMPDAIALRSDEKIAIEVIRKSRDGERRIKKVKELFKGHEDWKFRVVWVAPSGPTQPVQSQTPSLIRTRIAEIKELKKNRHFGPASLLAWATLEAVGRLLLPQKFERPQTPGRIVDVLASEGYITPSEADALRQLVEKRNKLVHGDLKTRISELDITEMINVLNLLTRMVGKQSSG